MNQEEDPDQNAPSARTLVLGFQRLELWEEMNFYCLWTTRSVKFSCGSLSKIGIPVKIVLSVRTKVLEVSASKIRLWSWVGEWFHKRALHHTLFSSCLFQISMLILASHREKVENFTGTDHIHSFHLTKLSLMVTIIATWIGNIIWCVFRKKRLSILMIIL